MNQKIKRILMTISGVLICGFSAGMFDFASFGMDPFQVFAHGIWKHTTLSFGTFYMLVNLILLLIIFLLDKSKIGLGTIINMFLLGYVVQFSSWLWKSVVFPNAALPIRLLFLLLAIVIMCLSSALYFTADMGVSTYDAVALILYKRMNWSFRLTRIGTDLVCVAIGFALGAIVGIGTLVTAFFMGPLISFFNLHVAEPLLSDKKAEKKSH